MGAPPTVMPGEPKVLLLWPVVVVPPSGADCPNVLPEFGSVPVVVGLEVPLLPNGEEPVVPVGEEGELLNGELLLLDVPPNPDPEEKPDDDPEDDPKGEEPLVVVPEVVPGVAPVGVMPLVFCSDWPNNPIGPTFASPR